MKGVRTIALRLTGTKEAAEELEAMGEDTSDMIMSQSKMRELIMNATKVASNNYKGFDIQDELGRYKSTYEIMLGLSQIWDEIRQADLKTGDNRQNLLLESIAGKNRASIASSILQNPDVLQSVYEDSSTKAAGSAMEENQKYLDSISGHLAKLQNAWQELWANAANRDVINMFIDLGTTILNLINDVGGLQSAFTLLYGGTILKGLMTADSWLVKFIQGLDNAKASSQGLGDTLNNVFTNLTGGGDPNKETRWKGLAQIQKNREDTQTGKTKSSIADETKEVIEANKELVESEELVQAATEGSTIAKEADMAAEGAQTSVKMAGAMAEKADATSTAKNTDETNKNTLATKANTTAEGAQNVAKGAGGAAEAVNNAGGIGGMIAGAVANPMTWLMAIPAILAIINTIIGSIKKQQQELVDSEKEAASTWQEAKTSIDEYAQKYQELHTQLQNTNLSEQDQINIKKQIYDLQKQITDEYGHAADGINLVNGNLDEQLAKLRQIKAEEARKNLLDNEKEYKNAQKAMEKERSYDMIVARNAPVTQDAKQILDKYGYELKQRSVGMGTIEQYIEFKGDASDAEQALKDLYNEVGEFSEDERASKGLNTFFDSISAATEKNNQILRDHQEAYNSFLEAKIFDNDNLYGDGKTAGEVLIQLEDAVNDYNVALQSGDTSQIEKTQKTFESLKGTVKEITQDMGEVYARPFDDIIDNVNTTAETAYNFRKELDDPKVHSMAEEVFGKFADTKKLSQNTKDEILDAAGEILNIQRELADANLTDIINPLYNPTDKKYNTKFGSIDLNNRPVLKWDKNTLKQYQAAWNSWGNWGEMPQVGDVSTVLGARGEFGKAGYEIAFTPLLEANGKLELLDKDTVSNYLNDIVDQATDKNGNVDTKKLLTLDADPRSGKKLITAYGKVAEKYDQIMHYVGTDGALTTAFAKLKKLADDNGLSFEKMVSSMAELGNRSGIRDMFKDAVPSIEDVRMALADTSGEFEYLQNFAEQEFGITVDTPDDQVYSFIETVMAGIGMVSSSSEEIQTSLNETFQDVSSKIEKVNSLSSIVSKGLGQGGLTFTKLLDEQGNAIESDVSKIRDAYQNMYDFDLGSLFEETATGIKLNMDAYRQLAQEEEASTKIQLQNQRDLLEARQRTLERQGAPDAQIRQLQEQITELDMLASAYDGATSATAKYLAQQNAADYGDTYEMFRDTTVKRANELINKGMVGTEEFRSIAQLFSYDSLAASSADKVLEAYQKGYANVSKYITEDARVGMQTFLDDLVALPEEYGKFTKDSSGNYLIEFTDAQEDKLAEHLNVSKDMLESFYDMLNALGFDIHFFRDGTLNEFDKLNDNINTSKERLKELKEKANDPNLIPDDVLDFNPEDLNTVEELQAHLDELQALNIDPKVNPEEYKIWKQLLEDIQNKINEIENAEIDPKVSLKDYETADQALEIITEKTEQAQKLAEKGVDIKAAVENDTEVTTLANQFANWPEQLQTYMGFEYSSDPEEIKRQLIEKITGEKIEVPVEPKIETPSAEEFNEPGTIGKAKVEVEADQQSIETAKQEAETGIAAAEPEIKGKVKMPGPDDYVWQGASIGEIHIPADVDPSNAESTLSDIKEDAEQPVETPLHLIPDNTAQDAANQAGAGQGVTTEEHKNTQVTETHNTVYTADTSGLDSANNAVNAMNGQTVNITINVTGQEKVESANKQITSLVNRAKTKVNVTINGNATAFNKAYTDVNNKLSQLGSKETVPKIKADNSNLKDKVEDSKRALNTIHNKEVTITAVQAGAFGAIASWKTNTYDQLHNKEIKIKTTYTSSGTKPKTGGGGYQGTAHYSGTVLSHGKAFVSGSSGNWGLKQDEEGALINELGGEVIVTPDGRWQILNNGYPTFANLEKGTIVFNHKQTEELLANGRIKGTHGKLVGGAFATGTTGWTGAMSGTAHGAHGGGSLISSGGGGTTGGGDGNNKGDNDDKGGGKKHKDHSSNDTKKSNQAAKDFLQTLDAIEIQLQRVDAEISRLDTNANKTYTSFSSRSSSIKKELKTVNKEIEKINRSISGKGFKGTAANPANYFKKALQASKAAGSKKDEGGSKEKHNRPGDDLTKYWTDRIKNAVDQGALLTIDDVHDEGLWKKIQAYQTWYEKGVKLKQKQQEYLNKLNTLTIQHLQLTQKSYESAINLITEDLNYNQQMIEAQQRFLKNDTIHFLNSNIKKDIAKRDKLQKEADELQAELNQAIKDGYITKDSEEYNTWTANIKKIKNDIIATENDMVNQTVAKMDYVQERWQSVLDMIDTEVEGYNTQIESRAYNQFIPVRTKGSKKLTPTRTKNDATLNDYNNIMIKDQQSINRLKKERKDIQKYLNEALRKSTDEGGIQKGSAIWREQQKRLKEIDNEIGSKTNDIVEQIVNQLEHITDKWDVVLDHIESHIDNIQARQDIRTEKGYAASEDYYRQEIAQQRQRRDVQVRQRNDLRAFLKKNLNVQTRLNDNGDLVPVIKNGKQVAKSGGKIAYGSKDYYEWMSKIQETTGDLLEIDKTLVKLNNNIRQLRWDAFDRAQEKIKNAAEEADFFNGLIYENKLFTENGQMTDQGRMSQGLITQQYDLYMKDAQQYGRMVKALNKQINKDPNNLDLIEQRDKWLEAQRQSIENAHKQKEAIRDLIEKGIKKQIEAMSKLIKKYEESLDAQRAQDQYAKSIADKQKRINSLQKQLKAMGGDDSEEGATKRQQLRDELKNAQQDLEDTQEDKRIADIKEALSNMQERYEEVLNARLENIEGLFAEAIQTTDANGANIVDSIERLAKSVGYDLSNEFAKASTDFVKALQGVKNVSDENKAGALVSNTDSRGKFDNSAATTVKNTTDSLPKEGTHTENGKKAFYFKGVKVKTGWNTIEGKKYYFNKDNTRLTGRQTIGNKDYYFGTDGALQVGTFKIGSTTYTTDKNGVIIKKEKHTSDPTPAKKTTTTKKKATTTTKKKTPAKETPVKKKHTSDPTPTKKTTATTTKKKTPGANYTGLWKDGSSTYYYVKGKKQTGWKDMKEGRRYFSTSGGKMLTGTQLIGGKTYLLDSSTGVLKTGYTGLYTQGKYKYYFVKGIAATGWQSMKEGKRYFSTVNGRMLTGLQKIGNASYYLDPKTGVIKTGSFTVGSIKYEADKNGKITKKNGTTVKGALAKGTANVNRAGMYRVDEEGNEVFINKNGKIYTRLDKGTTVLPHDAAINLLKGMSNPVEFIKSHMDMRPNKNITTHNTSDNVENHITFNLPNITSYKEFMREAQKDPNFTKYIQEISLGRLNGNNSLKGNSIRFK